MDLNIEMSIQKTIMALDFEIDNSSIYIIMTLKNQNIIVLFQIIVLESKNLCFKIIIYLLIYCLIDIIIKDKYS